ncbi:hypothetical protein ACH42_08440 [Endozoicomonas sp. (ex Bugula neritina AB1)]|nr:hypothetical protein ACH42_08440 [Endozoicomonas sp. (ex Bugula neritina AB1)]
MTTVRKVCQILATHIASRDMACIKPEAFKQEAAYNAATEEEQKMIRHFEAHRRHLLEAIAQNHPEVLDAISEQD